MVSGVIKLKESEMNKNQIQHGDILIRRIGTLPDGCQEVSRRNGRIIVAEGELTGHHHTIVAEGCRLLQLKNELYLEVTADQVEITHEEHKTLPIPKGVYQIGKVKEYDYIQEMERQVRD
jgi:hypothetical protein